MKIDETMRYPHPVLSEFTGDYPGRSFSMEFEITEQPSTGSLQLRHSHVVSDGGINTLLQSGQASIGIIVVCLETYYNSLVPLDPQGSPVDFPAGTLRGRVSIRPVIWTAQNVTAFSSDGLHPDFSDIAWDFSRGTILAIGLEQIVNIGKEKLAPMETIFSLSPKEGLAEGDIQVSLDGEKITILVSPATCKRMHALRRDKSTKAILLNSVFLPVVMDVLASLRGNEAEHAEKRWYKIFSAKCDHLGIKIHDCEPLRDALKLLKYPFHRIIVEEE